MQNISFNDKGPVMFVAACFSYLLMPMLFLLTSIFCLCWLNKSVRQGIIKPDSTQSILFLFIFYSKYSEIELMTLRKFDKLKTWLILFLNCLFFFFLLSFLQLVHFILKRFLFNRKVLPTNGFFMKYFNQFLL